MSLSERTAERQEPAPRSAREIRCATTPFELPDPDVRPRSCRACGCTYLDYAPGIDAHLIVFGHRPEAEE